MYWYTHMFSSETFLNYANEQNTCRHYVYMWMCVHMCSCTFERLHAHVCLCMYSCMCHIDACAYVSMFVCVCAYVYGCLWLSSVARWTCSLQSVPCRPLLFISCPEAMLSPEDLAVLCSGFLSLWAHFPCTHRHLSFPFLIGQWVRWELIAFWPWFWKGEAGVLCRSSLAAVACASFN